MGSYSLEKANGDTSSGEMSGKYTSKRKVEPGDESSVSSGTPEKKEKPKMVGVFEVFRFTTGVERLLMLIGTLCACAHGAAMPVMMIIFGDVTDTLVDQDKAGQILDEIIHNISTTYPVFENLTSDYIIENMDQLIQFLKNSNNSNLTWWGQQLEDSIYNDFLNQMTTYSLYYVYIGCAVLFVGYFQMMSWRTACYGQSERIRAALFKSILKQDIGWFDTHEVGELGSRLVDDVEIIEKGTGDKVSSFFQQIAGFVAGYIIGFIYGWKLTLVILSVSPLLAIAAAFISKMMSTMTKRELEAYAKAGAVAEEVLGAIRTVAAFGGEEKEVKRYNLNLQHAQDMGLKKGLISGIGIGSIFLVMFGSYALAFWYGSSLVRSGEYTPGTMLIVFFSVLMGAFNIGAAAPNIQDFSSARGAAHLIYSMIDLIPAIDSSSTEGKKPDKLIGNVEFKDIVFRYPSRPDIPILNGLSLKVNSGQTVALVGSSGCGKSTCIQLIQRFYDPLSGEITIDGRDIKSYNLKWLREHIGVVSQEPVLFGTTIAENIRYGREDVTQEEIEKATREANAYDFIMKLPDKFETMVGERGAQLSGGQKQRIAIARALVRDPKILLLDEATSALDTESEGIVQAALDKARQGRTTLVVAHRLSTIQTADIIAGVSQGVIVEQGTHEELMKIEGVYHTLVNTQMQMRAAEEDDDEKEKQDLKRAEFKRGMSVQSAAKSIRSRTVSTSESVHERRDTSEIMKDEELPDPSMGRLMALNKPELPLILVGCCAAIVTGLIQPAFALIFSSILGVFAEPDLEYQEQQCNLYSGMFAVIGVVAGLSNFTQIWLFGRVGEYLTTRLRTMAFSSLLKQSIFTFHQQAWPRLLIKRQEIAYFDDHSNGTGALCSRLSTDAAAVKGASGSRIATLIQSLASVGGGVIIGFIFSWKLALVVLAFAPFMMIGGFIEMNIFQEGNKQKNKHIELAAKVANECTENMRTVANLTREETFHNMYCKLMEKPYKELKKKAHLQGIAFAYSQAIVFFANAGCFAFGAWLVVNDGLSYESMFKVFTAILFGAMAAGQATSFAPDYGKAKLSAARMFALFDRESAIDSSSKDGKKLDSITGAVDLKDVCFTYPTRPDVKILKGVSVKAKSGQMVALVGSSGCGKSTIVQLIERFYDPASGQVFLDGHNTRDLNIQWLRSQIGIVSQEPILFDCSIRENIEYGDNTRDVTMDEIIAAARQSNIHSFIESLPQGYETNVGDKGAQLSGGQKQRVAIARALIRNPKILLLDEATSALDTESEKVVQEALERAQEGRTSIVIAHRLSTIKNADVIIVLHNGLVAEVGTHDELMKAEGFYFRLNTKQAKKREEEKR